MMSAIIWVVQLQNETSRMKPGTLATVIGPNLLVSDDPRMLTQMGKVGCAPAVMRCCLTSFSVQIMPPLFEMLIAHRDTLFPVATLPTNSGPSAVALRAQALAREKEVRSLLRRLCCCFT